MSPTTDRLRSDIDHGQAGDKVDFPDPAAAPLGTDEEAAGTPASKEAVALERRQQAASSVTSEQSETGDHGVLGYVLILTLWVCGFLLAVTFVQT